MPLCWPFQAEQDETDAQIGKWRAREERIATAEAAQRALLLERQEELQRRTAQATLEMQEETLRRSKSLAERQAAFEASRQQAHASAMSQLQEQIAAAESLAESQVAVTVTLRFRDGYVSVT